LKPIKGVEKGGTGGKIGGEEESKNNCRRALPFHRPKKQAGLHAAKTCMLVGQGNDAARSFNAPEVQKKGCGEISRGGEKIPKNSQRGKLGAGFSWRQRFRFRREGKGEDNTRVETVRGLIGGERLPQKTTRRAHETL